MIGNSPSQASFASRIRNRYAAGWTSSGLHFFHHSPGRLGLMLDLHQQLHALQWDGYPTASSRLLAPTTLTTKIAIQRDSAYPSG